MGYEELPSEGPYSPIPQFGKSRNERAIAVVMNFRTNLYHMCFVFAPQLQSSGIWLTKSNKVVAIFMLRIDTQESINRSSQLNTIWW